jgi:hypothetical protein
MRMARGPEKDSPKITKRPRVGNAARHQGFELVVAQWDIGGIGYDLGTRAKIQGP